MIFKTLSTVAVPADHELLEIYLTQTKGNPIRIGAKCLKKDNLPWNDKYSVDRILSENHRKCIKLFSPQLTPSGETGFNSELIGCDDVSEIQLSVFGDIGAELSDNVKLPLPEMASTGSAIIYPEEILTTHVRSIAGNGVNVLFNRTIAGVKIDGQDADLVSSVMHAGFSSSKLIILLYPIVRFNVGDATYVKRVQNGPPLWMVDPHRNLVDIPVSVKIARPAMLL